MSINVKKSIMIIPSEETPRDTLWLSRLDMIRRQPYSHTRVLFIYTPQTPSSPHSPTPFFDFDIMKEALSRALVPYYPMAGRIKVNANTGRPEIDCNAEGALFTEAETSHTLSDLGGETKPNNELRVSMLPSCDYTKGIGGFPLLLVQLTRFKCGGASLGFAQHHHVADGASHVQFINSWARLARGLDIGVKPVHDRAYVAPRDPPQIEFRHLHFDRPLPPKDLLGELNSTKECTFKLSEDQINVLRQQAASKDKLSYKLSTYNVVAAHVWRTACKARGLTKDQEVRLYIQVDGRSILKNPELPQGYCGNVIMCTVCIAKGEEITSKPLWYIASKIYEAVNTMKDSNYFRSAIDCLESHPNMENLVRGEHSSIRPSLSINSWAKMSFNQADFGWGSPDKVLNGGVRYDGQSYLLPSQNGDAGQMLSIRLLSHHMKPFEQFLYEF